MQKSEGYKPPMFANACMRSCETFKKEGALEKLALISPPSFLKVSQLRMKSFAQHRRPQRLGVSV
ncbi:MAG: hypothetical protein HW387_1116, partial [Parachlamydiales bacterium]|nr:hypothetical protein [Parachlamydiales bacterium]